MLQEAGSFVVITWNFSSIFSSLYLFSLIKSPLYVLFKILLQFISNIHID